MFHAARMASAAPLAGSDPRSTADTTALPSLNSGVIAIDQHKLGKEANVVESGAADTRLNPMDVSSVAVTVVHWAKALTQGWSN
jgi:hypothetical protein